MLKGCDLGSLSSPILIVAGKALLFFVLALSTL